VPAELLLRYRLEDRIALDGGTGCPHIERWTVSVLERTAGGADPVEIGYAHVLVFTLEPGDDIGDLADLASGSWTEAGARPAASPLPAGLAGAPGGTSHILLLDRVWLDPEHRGGGLGPVVAAAAMARLGRGCHLAACYPAPFEGPSRPPADQARAVEALGRVWSKVGFRHWRDGVWMLDLTTNDLQATLTGLLTARSAVGAGAGA
jgi:hypothetical protein